MTTTDVSAPRQSEQPPPQKPRLADHAERYALIGVWAAVAVILAVSIPDIFLRTDTLQTIFGTQSVLLILSLGLLFPLITAQFDLSIASVLTLSSMTVAILNAEHSVPIGLAVLVALLVGAAAGCVNALLIVGFGLDSFIVTLGMSTVLLGLVQLISDSQTVSGISTLLIDLTITNRIAFISLSFWFALGIALVVWVLLARTPLGRRLLVVGRSPDVARLSGLATTRLRAGSLIACSTFAALAGVVSAGTQGGADPSSGASYLLPTFAAVYLGGTAITPGRFNVWGTVVAVYFLVTGITGLQFVGVPNWVQQLFYGGALVIAVALSRLVRRQRERAAA
jgi:ribose transport system permease protein